MHRLRRERQERREDRLAVVDRLRGDVQHGPHPVRVGVLELPRLLTGQVAVGFADDPHRLLHRRFLPVPLDQPADGGEAGNRRRQQRTVLVVHVLAGRDLTDVRGQQTHRPVHQVPPTGDELVIVAADELRPGEVGVLGLGPATLMK